MFRPPILVIFREVSLQGILHRTLKQFKHTKCQQAKIADASNIDRNIKILYFQNVLTFYVIFLLRTPP